MNTLLLAITGPLAMAAAGLAAFFFTGPKRTKIKPEDHRTATSGK